MVRRSMNDRTNSTLEEARLWLQFSREDLDGAILLLATNSTVPRLVCWLAQQAAEKALKAALVCEEEDIAYTHDLEALAILLPETWAVGVLPEELARLSPWAVEARYPGEWTQPSESDAAQAMEMARQVYDSIEAEFRRRGVIG